MGHDVIKKLMWKDGHLVDDYQYYIRSRNPFEKGSFFIYQSDYAIRQIFEPWNEQGKVKLHMLFEISKKERSKI